MSCPFLILITVWSTAEFRTYHVGKLMCQAVDLAGIFTFQRYANQRFCPGRSQDNPATSIDFRLDRLKNLRDTG